SGPEMWFSALLKIDPESLQAPLLEDFVQVSPDHRVKLLAADQLLKVNPESKVIVPSLLRMLKDPYAETRRQIYGLLAKVGPRAREAIPLIVADLEAPRPGVRYEAARALKRIDPEGAARIVLPRETLPAEIRDDADLRLYAKARRDA